MQEWKLFPKWGIQAHFEDPCGDRSQSANPKVSMCMPSRIWLISRVSKAR